MLPYGVGPFSLALQGQRNVLAPDLWRNPKAVLALLESNLFYRHGRVAEEALARFESDREFWLEAVKGCVSSEYKRACPANLRSDPGFMLQAVRANHKICLECLSGHRAADLDLILAACAAPSGVYQTSGVRGSFHRRQTHVRWSSGVHST